MADPPPPLAGPVPPRVYEDLPTQFPVSYSNLQRARDAAALSSGYDSDATRSLLHLRFRDTHPGHGAKIAQVDVAEALLLGLDCTLIAGTGFGKTAAMILPSLAAPEKGMPLIFSPLKALQQDFGDRFEAMGLRTAILNGDEWRAGIVQVNLLLRPNRVHR
jgi:hypothetical protein